MPITIVVLFTMKREEYDLAIIDYTKAIELRPDLVHPYINRGNVYSKKGEYKRAIKDYGAAIERNTDLAEPHYNRGMAFIRFCKNGKKPKKILRLPETSRKISSLNSFAKNTKTLPTLNRNMKLNYQKTSPKC